MQITADTHDLKPPRPGRWLGPVGLALVAHALLMGALTWGVHWQQDEPLVSFEAELWSAVPREAGRTADFRPARGLIAGAGVTFRIDEGLR